MKVDLSIIIPLYNCESFIQESIESVIDINNIDVEIIVIDDGSTDDSANIVEEYGDKVRLLKVKNGGASYARNIGLRNAIGEYVMFMDSDDYLLDKNVCNTCIKKMKENNLSMCIFSLQHFHQDSLTFQPYPRYEKDVINVFDSGVLIEKMIRYGYFLASPCFRVLKRDFIINNNLFFKEHITAEDIEWFVRVILAIDRFCLINDNSYIYRKDVQNSVTSSFTEQKCYDFIEILKSSIEAINSYTPNKKCHALMSGLAYEYCILLANLYKLSCPDLFKEQINALSWILKYDMYPKVSYVKKLYSLFGFKLTSLILYKYSVFFAKSQKI